MCCIASRISAALPAYTLLLRRRRLEHAVYGGLLGLLARRRCLEQLQQALGLGPTTIVPNRWHHLHRPAERCRHAIAFNGNNNQEGRDQPDL